MNKTQIVPCFGALIRIFRMAVENRKNDDLEKTLDISRIISTFY